MNKKWEAKKYQLTFDNILTFTHIKGGLLFLVLFREVIISHISIPSFIMWTIFLSVFQYLQFKAFRKI